MEFATVTCTCENKMAPSVKELPSVEVLKSLFTLSELDGELRWKIKPPHSRINVGDVAGTLISGYKCVKINKRIFKVHRICYSMYHECIVPSEMVVDHIDRDPLNNCKDNLRLVTLADNRANRSDNKSGVPGVTHSIQRGHSYWYAKIIRNKKIYATTFPYTNDGMLLAVEWLRKFKNSNELDIFEYLVK